MQKRSRKEDDKKKKMLQRSADWRQAISYDMYDASHRLYQKRPPVEEEEIKSEKKRQKERSQKEEIQKKVDEYFRVPELPSKIDRKAGEKRTNTGPEAGAKETAGAKERVLAAAAKEKNSLAQSKAPELMMSEYASYRRNPQIATASEARAAWKAHFGPSPPPLRSAVASHPLRSAPAVVSRPLRPASPPLLRAAAASKSIVTSRPEAVLPVVAISHHSHISSPPLMPMEDLLAESDPFAAAPLPVLVAEEDEKENRRREEEVVVEEEEKRQREERKQKRSSIRARTELETRQTAEARERAEAKTKVDVKTTKRADAKEAVKRQLSPKTKQLIATIAAGLVTAILVFIVLALVNPTFVQQAAPRNLKGAVVEGPLDLRKAAGISLFAGGLGAAMPFVWHYIEPYASGWLPWRP